MSAFHDYAQETGQQVHRWAWLIMLVGGVLALGIAFLVGWPTAVTSTDIRQDRLDTALPAPQNEQTLTQTFVPRHNGLTEIKLILVKYELDDGSAPDGALTLTLRDERERIVATQTWRMRQVRHNQELFLRFSPEQNSAGQAYALSLSGTADNWGSVWGYRLNVLDTAVLTTSTHATAGQMFTFTTRYQLLPREALTQLGRDALRYGGLIFLILFLIFSPSAWLMVHPRLAAWEVNSRWGLALAVGLSAWGLLWLWPGWLGWHWAWWSLWLVVLGGWGTAIWLARRYGTRPWGRGADWLLPALLLFSLALRLIAVRDLTFLPWVDASRHALITAVMRHTGQTIWDYAPFLEVSRPIYHYGFHSLPATLQIMTADFWPLETTLLVMMQLLGALVPLAVYSGGWWLTRRRGVALLAAFLVAIPFYFPAYFLSWGRLTQLTGGLILPLLLAVSWALYREANAEKWRRSEVGTMAGLIGLLAAGLFLVHFRVFVFYLPLALLVGAGLLARRQWGGVAALMGGGLLTAVLVFPRLWQLATQANLNTAVPAEVSSYYHFPINYITIGWEQYYWYATAVLLGLLLLAALRGYIPLRQLAAPLLLLAWLGLTLMLAPGDIFPWRGVLPAVNLNSLYIIFFVPQSLFLATAVVVLWPVLMRLNWVAQVLLYAAGGALLIALLLFGVRQQINILNEETRLAWAQDQAGIAWVAENVPPDAKIAVNSWLWLPNAWASSDGGGWLLPLTQRATTTPPVDYTFERGLVREVIGFNEAAQAMEGWHTAVATDFLRQHGVTHVFVGQKGGFLDPAELNANPDLTLLYQQDGVFIFALNP